MIDVNDWDCRELYIRWNVAFVAFTDIAYPGHNFAIVCPLVHDIPFCKRADLCLRNEGVATTIKRSKVFDSVNDSNAIKFCCRIRESKLVSILFMCT